MMIAATKMRKIVILVVRDEMSMLNCDGCCDMYES